MRASESDLDWFLVHAGIALNAWEDLVHARPEHVARWRDRLASEGMTKSSIRKKMTALRSLFSYLHIKGFSGANPAHGDFVSVPAFARDDKIVGLSPLD